MKIIKQTRISKNEIFSDMKTITLKENATQADWLNLCEKARHRAVRVPGAQTYDYLSISGKEIRGNFVASGYIVFKRV